MMDETATTAPMTFISGWVTGCLLIISMPKNDDAWTTMRHEGRRRKEAGDGSRWQARKNDGAVMMRYKVVSGGEEIMGRP